MKRRRPWGFTLIELSIVLVVVGLLIGGVLVGRDLVGAAAVRAQLSQLEQYQAAVAAFQGEYGCLPGDCATAAKYGFPARGPGPGQGDGDGVLTGYYYNTLSQGGEPLTFWVDLSLAGLLDASLTTARPTSRAGGGNSNMTVTYATTPSIPMLLPPAKIGGGNYVSAWSGGCCVRYGPIDRTNYLSVSVPQSFNANGVDELRSGPGLTVAQAHRMDAKIDDGLPQSGAVQALYLTGNTTFYVGWAAGGGLWGQGNGNWPLPKNGPNASATPYAETNCYDNDGVAGTQRYSLRNGDAVNCALSFRLQ